MVKARRGKRSTAALAKRAARSVDRLEMLKVESMLELSQARRASGIRSKPAQAESRAQGRRDGSSVILGASSDSQRPSQMPPNSSQSQPDTQLNFMQYPIAHPQPILDQLDQNVKPETKQCIINLLNYRAKPTLARLPRATSAAVLVPLFISRSGDLYVVLSRHSEALRALAGDTILPGGKIDAQDLTVEDTARCEAFEEIGLPQDNEKVPLLCVMEPHLAKREMVVTPVVVLILDHSLQPNLNASEVTSIFTQPLSSFLSSAPHFPSSHTVDSSRPYHSFLDMSWGEEGNFRLHRFLTGREAEGIKSITGLTSAILIKIATTGYGRVPDFEVQPPNAPTPMQQISRALLMPCNPLRVACEQEGIDADEAAVRILCPPFGERHIHGGVQTDQGEIGELDNKHDATL